MSYYSPENGRSGPPLGWQPPSPGPSSHAGNGGVRPGIFDLAKGSLSITVVGTVLYAALTVGMAVGAYQERGANMAAQLVELKADVKAIKEALPEIRAALMAIKDRPQWTMHVDKR